MNPRILALIIKELLAVWRDKKSRIAILIPPMIQLFIFTFASTLDVTNISMGILNRDNGEQGFELTQRFHGAPYFKHITYLHGVEEIAPFIENQKGIVVLSLDQEFSRNLDANRPAEVQLILDGRKSNTAQIVAGYSTSIINRYITSLYKKEGIPQQNAAIIERNWFNPNLHYYWYNIPCLVGVLSMLTCLIVTAMSVARERELGTFDQLLVSPLLPREILLGKIIPGIIVGVAEAIGMIAVGTLIFGVPFTGSFLLLLAALFVFVSSISGVGLFISSICKTQQQAILGTFIFMVPSVLLAGFATPIENMPAWLQPVTYLMPLRYMLIISKGIFLKAMPPAIVLNNVWPMILIALFSLTVSGTLFRRRLE